MKKNLHPLILICMIFALTACAGIPAATMPANKEETPAAQAPAEPAESEEETPAVQAPADIEEHPAENEEVPDPQGDAADKETTSPADEDGDKETSSPARENGDKETFSYVHDPRENPEAMADIVENADAVYGFSPDPQSRRLGSYAEYDWTDPELVAQAKTERIAYHDSMDSMTDIIYEMRDEGASIEEIARAVSEERNRLRLESYKDEPEALEKVKKSNLETYGHEEGPLPDELFEKYGSWTAVLQKAFSPNLGMDVCCGLYDEYYWLYIELGLAAE